MKNFLQNNIKAKYLFIGVFIVVGRLLRNRWAMREWEKTQVRYAAVLSILLSLLLAGVCVGLVATFS